MTREEIAGLIETIARKYDDHDDPIITRRDEPLPPPTDEEWRAIEESSPAISPILQGLHGGDEQLRPAGAAVRR